MSESYISIDESQSNKMTKFIDITKGYILINIIFVIIGIVNIEIYATAINLSRVSLLWIFVFTISYNMNVDNLNYLKILKITSMCLIILGSLSIAKVNGTEENFFIINFLLTNACNYIFFKYKEKLNAKKLITLYVGMILLYAMFEILLGTKINNHLFIIANLIWSFYNLILSDNDYKTIKHFNLVKTFSYIIAFGNIIAFIYCMYENYQNDIVKGGVYLILFNYTYYGYKYTIKNIIKNPYFQLLNINNELDNKSKQLNQINTIIENEMNISKKIKSYINQRTELLNQSLDAMQNIWIVTDYNLNFIYINKTFKEIFKHNKEMKSFELILDEIEDGDLVKEDLLNNKSREIISDRIIYIKDKIYKLNINNNFFNNTYLICLTDITNETNIEKDLEFIMSQYKHIIDNIPKPILIRKDTDDFNLSGVITVNKRFEEKFDFSRDKMKELNLLEYYDTFNIEFIDKKTYEVLDVPIEKRIKNIRNNGLDYNLMTMKPNAECISMEVKIDDYIDQEVKLKIVTLKDITEDVNTYKEINNQNKIYKQVLDTLPEGLIFTSKSKGVIYTNKSFDNIFGIDEFSDKYTCLTDMYIKRIHTKYLYNKSIGKKDKSIYIVNQNKKIKEIKVVYKNCSEESQLIIIKDLGGQRKAERMKNILIRQREYDQMKMEFYANISHELKTPLNNIYSSTQLIENLYNKGKLIDFDNVIYKHIKIVKQNMFRLVRLIDNIINISQVKSEIYKIKSVNFDIIYLIEEIITSIQPYANSRNLNIIFDTNEDYLSVGLDPETIERIILNLLSNSIKFTPEGKTILVGVYKIKEKVQVIVEDQGIGIAKEKLIDIFDRFKQIEDGKISNEFGSGIGLYLSKSLVELQDGTIDIKSEENKGTKTIIEFPIKEVDEENMNMLDYGGNIEKFKIEFFDIYK